MRKQWLAWLLALCLTAALWSGRTPEAKAAGASVWDGTVATEFAGGKGTEAKPYLIETAQQLAYLAQSVNGGTDYSGEYVSLQADLDLSRLPWTPIGTETNSFRGTFLGNAHTIANLYVNAPSADYRGLFGYIENGGVQNLRLSNISVSGNQYVGGVAGYLVMDTTVQECNVSGSVSGMSYIGGVNGWGGRVIRCINNASVFANQDYAGGVSGRNASCILCVNHGDVDAYGQCVGGIAGAIAYIVNCWNAGSIGGNAAGDVGGVVGSANYSSQVMYCGNIGAVTASRGSAGGIGAGDGSYAHIPENCYNAGMVNADNAYSIAPAMKDCYALRAVAEELDEKEGDGLTILDEMNTPTFAATLNRNINTEQYSKWSQDSNVYGGFPYFEPRIVSSIAVTTPPTKNVYAPGETFDPTGMIVTAQCTDGSDYELSLNALTFFPNTSLAEGTASVTVFYGSMSATCAIAVSIEAMSEYTIENLSVKDSVGTSLSSIPQGRFLAVIAVRRNRPGDNAMVLLASYTAAGQFRELSYEQVNKPVGETTYVTVPVDNASGNIGQIKAFVIHSFDDLRPLGTSVSFPAA